MDSAQARSEGATREILGALIAVAIGAIVGLQLSEADVSPHSAAPGTRPLDAIFDTSQRLLIPGRQVADAAAGEREMGFPLPTPADENPTEVWVSSTGEAGARFGSTLVLTYNRINPRVSPAALYSVEAADWGLGSATTLKGNPAWVIPDHPDNPAPGVAYIHVAINGVEVTLFGKMSIEELTAKAENLRVS